jgi:hypothetical protein
MSGKVTGYHMRLTQEGSGRFREAELSKAENKVALLTKYEQELQEELKKVQGQLEELKKEA